jgi:predicted TIM-barrel fold metal-dependent hydrolase
VIEPLRGQSVGGWDCHVHVFSAAAPARRGHYRPGDHPLAQIKVAAQGHGVDHLVIVQPSVYGTDNQLLLDALAVDPGWHRGIVVVDPHVSDAQLDEMHALGVRGVRFNLVSPVGERTSPMQGFATLAPRLRKRNWHVQWYVGTEHLSTVAALHRDSGVTCVLDHLAGIHAGVAAGDPAWRFIEDLAMQGAWIKLSGWYRLNAREPYSELVPQVRRLAALFRERMVWGSDWPHTMFKADALPSYESTWHPVEVALGVEAAHALRCAQPGVYR